MHTYHVVSHESTLTVPENAPQSIFYHIGNARQTRSRNQIAIRFFELVVHHNNCHPPLGSRLKQLAEIETAITECSSSNSIAAARGNLRLRTVITDLEIVCGGEPIL